MISKIAHVNFFSLKDKFYQNGVHDGVMYDLEKTISENNIEIDLLKDKYRILEEKYENKERDDDLGVNSDSLHFELTRNFEKGKCIVQLLFLIAIISIYCLVEIEVDNYNEINELSKIKSKFKLNLH